MNKADFIAKMKSIIPMSPKEMRRIIHGFVHPAKGNLPRGYHNAIIANEEMAELQQQLSKWLRGLGDNDCLLEEMADVQICIWTMLDVLEIPREEFNKAISVKLERVEEKTHNLKDLYV